MGGVSPVDTTQGQPPREPARFEAGATLIGSTNLNRYQQPVVPDLMPEAKWGKWHRGLLLGENVDAVGELQLDNVRHPRFAGVTNPIVTLDGSRVVEEDLSTSASPK